MHDLPILAAGLLIFIVALVFTIIGTLINLKLFPGFISREKKSGIYRIEDMRKIPSTSTKLPHLGGVAVLIGFTISLLLASNLGWVEANFRWFLLPVWGFGLAGLVDDYKKTQGDGVSEKTKLIFVVSLSLLLSLIFYFRFGFDEAYSPYNRVSYFLLPAVWAVWFVLSTTAIATATTLAVGFSDGIDGLLGGLWLIAASAYAVFTTVNEAAIASAISFALVGSACGFLIFNQPSSWSAGKPRSQRRAKIYLGETGSMMVGGAFAFLAILSQTELAWIIIGGVFVLEGASALFQAKLLTPLFRRFLKLIRHMHNGNGGRYPHTEFPLPFLATPYHCHLDLIRLGRLRIVKLMWGLGVALAVLGIGSALVQELFGKTVLWLAGISLIVGSWTFGAWTKSVFFGLHQGDDGQELLSINRGMPFELFGRKIYWTEEIVPLRAADLEHFGFLLDVMFWKPISKFDALITIGYVFYQIGKPAEALAYWDRVPESTFKARPETYHVYLQVQTAPAESADEIIEEMCTCQVIQ
jgi:UDP-N-acetylmuramyl pentapeptide phosphotransferase/UDP-N-acetylglucosamine-1-phosphate transferase